MSKFDPGEIARKYEASSEQGPVVVATGYGDSAEQIISLAEQQGIPVYRDDSVASLLCMLDIGRSIPNELHTIISRIYCGILMAAEKQGERDPSD